MTERNDLNDWDRQIIEEFRANGGNVGGQFAGAPLLLLTTTGAKIRIFLKREQPISDDVGVKNPGRVNLQRTSKEPVVPSSTNGHDRSFVDEGNLIS